MMQFVRRALIVFSVISTCVACQPRMQHQPKLKTYSGTSFYADGSSARPLPADVVPYHQELESSLPQNSLTALNRGHERYDIYCSVCHGLDGRGGGMAVLRGFTAPRSFLSPILMTMSLRQFVLIEGDGAREMLGLKDRLSLSDRWDIALYIRALQFSQKAAMSKEGSP